MKSFITSAIAAAIGGATAKRVSGRGPGGSLLRTGLGVAASRVALRSLPGAALVGGLMLARHAYKRRQDRAAELYNQGEPAPPETGTSEPGFGDTPDCIETVQRTS